MDYLGLDFNNLGNYGLTYLLMPELVLVKSLLRLKKQKSVNFHTFALVHESEFSVAIAT